MKTVFADENEDIKKLKFYAEKAKEKIWKNNYLHKLYDLYIKYIREIKSILLNKAKIEDQINNLNLNLKNNIEKTKIENQKIKNKFDILYKNFTDELEMIQLNLSQIQAEEFTLKYSNIQKNNLIEILKQNLKCSKIYNIFREPRRDVFLDIKKGNISFKNISDESQLNLLIEAKKVNKLKERKIRKNKKLEKLKKILNELNEYIRYFNKTEKKINSNSANTQNKTIDETPLTCKYETNENPKLSKKNQNFEEDYNKVGHFNENSKKITNAILLTKIPFSLGKYKSMSLNSMIMEKIPRNETDSKNNFFDEKQKNKIISSDKNYITNKNKALSEENRKGKKIKNPKKNKIIQSFINLEDLFEITDSENEKEDNVLIDTVLYSDDETNFENKIIPNKSLTKTYKEKIKKELPKINLSLIEYNKLKVYQEVDLYSLQRRDYKGQNIEDNIKILSKKIKKMKTKENLNFRKVQAIKKFIDDLNNKYLSLKRIKTFSTAINNVKYISNNEIIDINKIENEIEDENEEGSDYLNEDDEISENN